MNDGILAALELWLDLGAPVGPEKKLVEQMRRLAAEGEGRKKRGGPGRG